MDEKLVLLVPDLVSTKEFSPQSGLPEFEVPSDHVVPNLVFSQYILPYAG